MVFGGGAGVNDGFDRRTRGPQDEDTTRETPRWKTGACDSGRGGVAKMAMDDERESQTVPTLRLREIDLLEDAADPDTLLVYLKADSSTPDLQFGEEVYVGDRPLSPQTYRISKTDLGTLIENLNRQFADLTRSSC